MSTYLDRVRANLLPLSQEKSDLSVASREAERPEREAREEKFKERMEIRALKRRIKEIEAIERAKSNLKRPSEYDRQLCRAIDMTRVKDSFKALVESICFNVTTKQYNRASPKQRLILLRTLAGQTRTKVDFKTSDETVYIRALINIGVLQ